MVVASTRSAPASSAASSSPSENEIARGCSGESFADDDAFIFTTSPPRERARPVNWWSGSMMMSFVP